MRNPVSPAHYLKNQTQSHDTYRQRRYRKVRPDLRGFSWFEVRLDCCGFSWPTTLYTECIAWRVELSRHFDVFCAFWAPFLAYVTFWCIEISIRSEIDTSFSFPSSSSSSYCSSSSCSSSSSSSSLSLSSPSNPSSSSSTCSEPSVFSRLLRASEVDLFEPSSWRMNSLAIVIDWTMSLLMLLL